MFRRSLLALSLAALLPARSYADLSLKVAGVAQGASETIHSKTISASFHAFGTDRTIPDLTPGVSTTVTLDDDSVHTFNKLAFSGTVGTTITIDGVVHTEDQPFILGSSGLSFGAAGPMTFVFSTYQITVTPIASTDVREATFLETPLAAAVPEPSSLWVAALGGAGFAGYGWRRARRSRAAS